MNKNPNQYTFYPILLALYPVLAALGLNIHEIYLKVAFKPLLFFALGGVALFAFGYLVSGSWDKAALFSGWTVLLFFSYGWGLKLFEKINLPTGPNPYLPTLIFWALLWSIGLYFLNKIKQHDKLRTVLNWFSIFLLIIPVFQITSYQFSIMRAKSASPNNSPLSENQLTLPESPPDVYVIVLDAHPRSDALKKNYGVDNQEFIRQLEEIGFFVPRCSRSNYAYTELSLSSMFNMNYLEVIAPEVVAEGKSTVPLYAHLKNSEVRHNFESLGYKTYSLVSYPPIAWEDADVFIDPQTSAYEEISITQLSAFERMVYSSTLLKVFLDKPTHDQGTADIPPNYLYADHLRTHNYILKKLVEIAAERGPKFVFVHLTSPHAPFVFEPDGTVIKDPPVLPWQSYLSWADYRYYFGMQVEYIDNAIVPIIKRVIGQSNTDPVILLIGDHGAALDEEQLANLSAYLVPEGVKSALRPDISLVNSFRVIFNQLYDGNYEILEDRSFYSIHAEPFNYKAYPESFPDCIP
jgi:hypothetical protein